jgi:hypothetical protein
LLRFAAVWVAPATLVGMTNRYLIIPVLAFALVPTACGGSDKPSVTATTTARPAATKTPAAIPRDLMGTWKTKLRTGDVPAKFHLANPFSVIISPNGGVDGAPSLTLADSRETIEGETSTPVVTGNTITLRHEGCFVEGSGYRFYDNVYRYAISGGSLRFTVVKNACKDHLAESILTTRAFTRRG